MSDKQAYLTYEASGLTQAVIAWRDVRERIFRCDGLPPPALWTELGHAEVALMAIARNLDDKPNWSTFTPWGKVP